MCIAVRLEMKAGISVKVRLKRSRCRFTRLYLYPCLKQQGLPTCVWDWLMIVQFFYFSIFYFENSPGIQLPLL